MIDTMHLFIFKKLVECAPKQDRYRVVKFIGSLLVAILCVVLLSALSGCSTEKSDVVESIESCIQESSKNTAVSCEEIYQPVCGCDGQTYANACEAVYVYGVASWTAGACEISANCEEAEPDSIACFNNYEPVCGCNGKTYPNACWAEAHRITEYTSGRCGTTSLSICRGESLEIGVPFNEERTYQWMHDAGCNDCSQLFISPLESNIYELQVFLKEEAGNSLNLSAPVAIYLFDIKVESCSY